MLAPRCPECGLRPPRAPVGRPRRQVDVAKLSDAFHRTRSVRRAACELGIPPATAWDRLRDAGLVGNQNAANGAGGNA